MIYFNGVCKSLITPIRISVGSKPTFDLKYENNGICKCGYEREFSYHLLNDEKEIENAKGLFSIEPCILLLLLL